MATLTGEGGFPKIPRVGIGKESMNYLQALRALYMHGTNPAHASCDASAGLIGRALYWAEKHEAEWFARTSCDIGEFWDAADRAADWVDRMDRWIGQDAVAHNPEFSITACAGRR